MCEYEAQLNSVKEAQAAAKAAAGGGQDLEQEVQEAFEEMNTQRAIYEKCARLRTHKHLKLSKHVTAHMLVLVMLLVRRIKSFDCTLRQASLAYSHKCRGALSS